MSGNVEKEDFADWLNLCQYYNALDELNSKNSADLISTKLYHYTSTRVLNAILSKGAFRASNLFYLNDKIEYRMGIDVLKRVFEKDEVLNNYIACISDLNGREWAGIYSISFSNKEDELQQWITYARESGVCIELNSDIIWERDNEEKDRELQLGIKGGTNSYLYYSSTCFLKLAYEKGAFLSTEKLPQLDANRIKRAFAKAILEFNDDWIDESVLDEECIQRKWEENPQLAQNFLKLLSAYYKEERFKGEGEIRAAFLPARKDKKIYSQIEYFEQPNGILRPYMDVFFFHNYHNGDPYKVECPIKSITIGPGGGQDSVFDSVVHRLEYGDTKVWEYTKEEKEKLLAEYVYGCFQQYNEKIENGWYRKIADKIIQKWCNKIGYQYKIEEATKIKVKIRIWLGEEEKKEIDDKQEKEIDAIVESFLKDNYFSSKGIWVKKSSVSYIF